MRNPTIADMKPIVMTLGTGSYYWYTCRLSANQPFRNGAHKGIALFREHSPWMKLSSKLRCA
jgi:CDGSH-type Zn-finger protein